MKEKFKIFFKALLKFLLIVGIVAVVFLVLYLVLDALGVWQKINSIEKLRNLVESGGPFAWIIFVVLQILQTTILQIPSIVVTLLGAWIFGSWPAFFMSFVAIMVGSIIMFLLGRTLGVKFLNFVAGKETAEKWIKVISKGKYLYFLMMLFPMFPDDILCAVAGVTDMSFGFFFWTNVIARGLGVACAVFFGTGEIIPFSGWGIPVWLIVGCVLFALMFLSIKFNDKIDDLLNKNKKPHVK